MDNTRGGGVDARKTRFTGKSILVSHIRGGENFRSVGWLESDGRSLAGAEIPPEFALKSPGTRIAILGYNGGGDWKATAARQIIAHFFHAVCHGNLRVRIADAELRADSLDDWLSQFTDRNLKERLRERIEVSRLSPIASAKIDGIGGVNLRARLHEDGEDRSKTLILVRDAGMTLTDKITDMRLSDSMQMVSFPRRWKGFVGIVECLSGGERSLLREAEAPSHDKISPDNADESDRAAVRGALRELGNWVRAEIEKLAAPPELGDTQSATELAGFFPLDASDGAASLGASAGAEYEIAQPVKSKTAPRSLIGGKPKKKPKVNLPGGKSKKRKDRKRKKRRQQTDTEIVVGALNDQRRLRSSLQWPNHSAKFSFDKPDGEISKIELYAKGEDGKDERIHVERAFLGGNGMTVQDGAVVEPDFSFVGGDRVQIEFKAISPVSDKRLEIRAER